MITMEIKKLVDAKFSKLAQIEFIKPGVGLIKTKKFLAWGFGVAEDAKVGDKVEITKEEFATLRFEAQDLGKNEDGSPKTCLRVKLA